MTFMAIDITIIILAVNIGYLALIPCGIGQVFLSLRPNRKIGWILPSIYIILGVVLTIIGLIIGDQPILVFVVVLCLAFPVIVLLAIYWICRHICNKKAKSELERMNIQDLD